MTRRAKAERTFSDSRPLSMITTSRQRSPVQPSSVKDDLNVISVCIPLDPRGEAPLEGGLTNGGAEVGELRGKVEV
jgi:hypothetical protein